MNDRTVAIVHLGEKKTFFYPWMPIVSYKKLYKEIYKNRHDGMC